jgi:NosR/NirI family transcriptional regulator, nitrous oxide reductase regulator
MLKINYPVLNTRRLIKFIVIILLFISSAEQGYAQQQRFPMPEFESGYQQPEVTTPEPRSAGLEYFDVFVLLAALAFGSWLVIKKRSRRWILALAIFALLYFGFYKNGCICAIGAVQNMALSMSDPGYAVSYTVIAFFMLPLLFSLAMGRIFCGSVCPLGAIQDIFVIKPVKVPVWIQKSLGLFPFVYLGLAVLYASTGTDFIICRYDPFVGIFRMGAEFHLMVLGAAFLLTGMFVARPYCRFVCPYGALLRVTSLFSKQHLTITPSKCIQCKLCANSCPFGAIEKPTTEKALVNMSDNTRKFLLYAAIIPLLMVVGGLALSSAHTYMAKANPDVYLAHLLIENPEITQDLDNLDVQTFLGSGRTMDSLVDDAGQVQAAFKTGGWVLGAFLGLVIGIMIISPMIIRRRTDYQPNRGDCYSCGRCLKYCPVQK